MFLFDFIFFMLSFGGVIGFFSDLVGVLVWVQVIIVVFVVVFFILFFCFLLLWWLYCGEDLMKLNVDVFIDFCGIVFSEVIQIFGQVKFVNGDIWIVCVVIFVVILQGVLVVVILVYGVIVIVCFVNDQENFVNDVLFIFIVIGWIFVIVVFIFVVVMVVCVICIILQVIVGVVECLGCYYKIFIFGLNLLVLFIDWLCFFIDM